MQEYIKKMLKSGHHFSDLALPNNKTTLTISNEEMEDIMKIVKSVEDSVLFLFKNKKVDFLVCY